MARQSLFSYKVDVTQIEGFAEKLAQFDPAKMAELLIGTVNEVATETYDLARSKMLAGINLNETYVKNKMRFKAATKSAPTAEIVAPVGKGFLTNISHYGAMQKDQQVNWTNETIRGMGKRFGQWPGWVRRTGSEAKGISVNRKIDKMSASVTKGANKSLGRKFVIPGKKDTEGNLLVFRSTGLPGSGVMDRNRKRSRDGIEPVLGPSVYQLFRFTAERIQDEVTDNLELAVVEAAEREFLKAIL
jgi:hypothetical protein